MSEPVNKLLPLSLFERRNGEPSDSEWYSEPALEFLALLCRPAGKNNAGQIGFNGSTKLVVPGLAVWNRV